MSPLPTVTKPKGWRQRIRESRGGTLLVLGVTATIVIVGAYMMDRPASAASGLQAISLSGPTDGAPPKIGTPAQDFTATTVNGTKVSLSSHKGHPVWLTFGATFAVRHVRRRRRTSRPPTKNSSPRASSSSRSGSVRTPPRSRTSPTGPG